jgi:hypothetical protein
MHVGPLLFIDMISLVTMAALHITFRLPKIFVLTGKRIAKHQNPLNTAN